jgi:hypothetical protein
MHTALEPIADTIPLTVQERERLAELESVIESRLEAFLATGRALAEIRNKRLYRQDFATWEDYCTRKWGLGYSRANELIRSTEIAEGLLASCAGPGGDAPLPDDLSPDALKPLQKLPPPLQTSCWRLASRITAHPTGHIVSKIVRTIQGAINSDRNGSSKPKPKLPQSEKKLFLLSVHRLSDSPYFSAHLIVQGLDEAKARKHRAACNALISRCHEVLEAIRAEFPQL